MDEDEQAELRTRAILAGVDPDSIGVGPAEGGRGPQRHVRAPTHPGGSANWHEVFQRLAHEQRN